MSVTKTALRLSVLKKRKIGPTGELKVRFGHGHSEVRHGGHTASMLLREATPVDSKGVLSMVSHRQFLVRSSFGQSTSTFDIEDALRWVVTLVRVSLRTQETSLCE